MRFTQQAIKNMYHMITLAYWPIVSCSDQRSLVNEEDLFPRPVKFDAVCC